MLTADRLLGHPVPRVGTPVSGDPRRVLEILAFAKDVLQVDLLPWQMVLFDRALRVDPVGKWTHRTSLAITARQSGKSRASAIRALAELMLWDGRLVISAAQSRDIALESWRQTVDLAEEAGLPVSSVRRSSGSEEMVLRVNGHDARLKVVTASAGGGRGLSADLVILDEIASLKTVDPYAALEKARRARPNSQCWAITTEGDYSSIVLEGLQEQGRAAAAMGDSSGICYLEWSARPDREPDDREGWAEANPALGYLIDEETIAAEFKTDPRSVFERETLCRRTRVEESWLPTGSWESCADPDATVPDDAARLVFGIDAAPSLLHASIAVAWARDDGKVHSEAVATFDGSTASGQAETRLTELVARWKPTTVVVASKGAAEAVAVRVGAATGTTVTSVSGTDLDRASRSFFQAVASRRIVHPPDVVLADHLAGAQAGEPGLFVLRRRNHLVNIDAAVASVLAVWGVDRVPVATTPTWFCY